MLGVGDALAVGLINCKGFTENDFFKVHPGGSLGQRLRLEASAVMHHENIPKANQHVCTKEALAILDKGKLGAVVLTDELGALAGILTDGDVRRAVCNGCLNTALPVSQIMIKNPQTGKEGQSVAELLDIMEAGQITVLPIVNASNKLVGIVHLHDLLGKGSLSFSQA